MNAHGQQHRQHRGAVRRRDAEIGAERDEVPVRHGHRDAAEEPRGTDQRLDEIRAHAEYRRALAWIGGERVAAHAAPARAAGRSSVSGRITTTTTAA